MGLTRKSLPAFTFCDSVILLPIARAGSSNPSHPSAPGPSTQGRRVTSSQSTPLEASVHPQVHKAPHQSPIPSSTPGSCSSPAPAAPKEKSACASKVDRSLGETNLLQLGSRWVKEIKNTCWKSHWLDRELICCAGSGGSEGEDAPCHGSIRKVLTETLRTCIAAPQ